MRRSFDGIRETNGGKLPAYAWPGFYPIIYYSAEGYVFCPGCADQEDAEPPITVYDVHWEGPPEYCDGCGKELESAYGDPDADEDEEE
jgi:hypothetical protein